MTGTIDTLLREIAALLKQSASLKLRAQELFKTADDVRHKAERMKDSREESTPQESKSN